MRQCLVCETELGPDPRSRTCSGRCRVWLHRAGGARGAAGIFASWASAWEAIAQVQGAEEARKMAATLRARAHRCREAAILVGA